MNDYKIDNITQASELGDILELVKNNIDDLQKFHYNKPHEFKFYLDEFTYRHAEIQLMLSINHLNKHPIFPNLPQIPYSCLVCKNIENKIIGFIIYCFNHKASPAEKYTSLNISYLAVHKDFRYQGIMRNMIDKLAEVSDSMVLACDIDHCEIYKKVGFTVHKPSGSQIGMIRGETKPVNYMEVDIDSINRILQYKAIQIKGREKFNRFISDYTNAYESQCEEIDKHISSLK